MFTWPAQPEKSRSWVCMMLRAPRNTLRICPATARFKNSGQHLCNRLALKLMRASFESDSRRQRLNMQPHFIRRRVRRPIREMASYTRKLRDSSKATTAESRVCYALAVEEALILERSSSEACLSGVRDGWSWLCTICRRTNTTAVAG